MLITTLLLAAMAPAPTAAVDTTRAAFTKCLREDMKKAREQLHMLNAALSRR